MNDRVKVLVVPVLVVTMWALPGDRATEDAAAIEDVAATQVAGVTSVFEPLADAAPTTVAASTTVLLAPATAPTTIAVSTVDDQTPSPTSTPADPPATTVTVEPASTTTVAPVTTAARSLGVEALERVSFDWQTVFPRWQVEFHGARDGIRALTYPGERRIEIFIRPTDTAATLHRVFAHELGHVVDVEMNSDLDRTNWLDQRGISQETPWWPSAQSPDFDTGAGDFAEAFAVWETGVSTRSTIGDQPDSTDLELVRELAQG